MAVDGQPVTGNDSLQRVMSKKRGGDMLNLTVYRNGRTQEIRVKLGEAPQRLVIGWIACKNAKGPAIRVRWLRPFDFSCEVVVRRRRRLWLRRRQCCTLFLLPGGRPRRLGASLPPSRPAACHGGARARAPGVPGSELLLRSVAALAFNSARILLTSIQLPSRPDCRVHAGGATEYSRNLAYDSSVLPRFSTQSRRISSQKANNMPNSGQNVLRRLVRNVRLVRLLPSGQFAFFQ